jgi:hypothetical protein
LAWISGNDEVYFVSKEVRREFGNIRENRGFIHLTPLNFLRQEFDCIGFDLHISDDSQVWYNSSHSEVETSVSAE